MKKRKQHYVWRHYLKAWASNDKIFCLREDKIFQPNLMGIAQERDFYRLKELTLSDIDNIEKYAIKPSPKILQPLHYQLLETINYIFQIKNQISNNNFDNEIDILINNFEEDMHVKIESIGIKYLDSIYKHDLSFFETENGCKDFLYYLCVQYMRTKNIKMKVVKTFENDSIDMDKIWNVLSNIFAVNMGGSLYQDRNQFKIVLLFNQTNSPFITGDQPVINTYSLKKSIDEIVEELEFYYPISPTLAILITEKEEYTSQQKISFNSPDKIEYFNNLVYQSSYEAIYSNQNEILRIIKNEDRLN